MNRPERKRKRKAPSSASSESSSKSASEESQKVSDEGPCWGCHTSYTPGDECVYEYCCLHTTHCGNWAHENCCTAEDLYSGEELEACSDCDGETHKYLCPACYESWNDQGSRDVHVRADRCVYGRCMVLSLENAKDSLLMLRQPFKFREIAFDLDFNTKFQGFRDVEDKSHSTSGDSQDGNDAYPDSESSTSCGNLSSNHSEDDSTKPKHPPVNSTVLSSPENLQEFASNFEALVTLNVEPCQLEQFVVFKPLLLALSGLREISITRSYCRAYKFDNYASLFLDGLEDCLPKSVSILNVDIEVQDMCRPDPLCKAEFRKFFNKTFSCPPQSNLENISVHASGADCGRLEYSDLQLGAPTPGRHAPSMVDDFSSKHKNVEFLFTCTSPCPKCSGCGRHGIYSDSDKHDKLGPFPKGTLSSGSTFKVENTANKNVLRYKLLEQYLRANKHFVHGSKAGVYYQTGSCWQKIESSSHIFQDLDAGNKIWKKKTKGQYVANMALSASAKRLDDMAGTIQFLQSQNFASPIDQESAPAAKVETKKSKKSAKKSAQSEVWDKVVELYNDPNWFLHHGLDQAMLACVVTCYTQNKIRTAYILDPNFVKFQEPDDWPHDQAFQKIAGKVPCKGQFRPQDKGRFPPPNITKRRDDVSASSKVADGLVRIGQSISSLTNAQAGQSLGPQISVSSEEKQAKYLNALTALQLDPGATEAVQMQLAELIKIMQNTTKMALVGSWLVTATRVSKFNLEEMDMDSPEFGNFKNYFYGLWRVNAGAVGVGPPTFD